MSGAIRIAGEWTAARLHRLAAVLPGMSRAEAGRIGGMDRQTLRDGVHPFNAS